MRLRYIVSNFYIGRGGVLLHIFVNGINILRICLLKDSRNQIRRILPIIYERKSLYMEIDCSVIKFIDYKKEITYTTYSTCSLYMMCACSYVKSFKPHETTCKKSIICCQNGCHLYANYAYNMESRIVSKYEKCGNYIPYRSEFIS